MNARPKTARWNKTHPRPARSVQGEIFGAGAVGDMFRLTQETTTQRETMTERRERETRENALDLAQGRLF